MRVCPHVMCWEGYGASGSAAALPDTVNSLGTSVRNGWFPSPSQRRGLHHGFRNCTTRSTKDMSSRQCRLSWYSSCFRSGRPPQHYSRHLRHSCACGRLMSHFRWLLSNHTVRVRVSNNFSSPRSIKQKVPHVSVLSPLVFTLAVAALLRGFSGKRSGTAVTMGIYANDIFFVACSQGCETIFCMWSPATWFRLDCPLHWSARPSSVSG